MTLIFIYLHHIVTTELNNTHFVQLLAIFNFLGISLIGGTNVNKAYYIIYIKRTNFQELSTTARPILGINFLSNHNKWCLNFMKTLRKLGVMYLLRKIFDLTCCLFKIAEKLIRQSCSGTPYVVRPTFFSKRRFSNKNTFEISGRDAEWNTIKN